MRVRDKYTSDFSEPHLRDRTSEPHLRDLEISKYAKTQHAGVAFSILPNDIAVARILQMSELRILPNHRTSIACVLAIKTIAAILNSAIARSEQQVDLL